MPKPPARTAIRLRGVRHNNLKNFDLDLPLNKLLVLTGLSGSGKSSLAFDTLFAEGQRRYIETFSPYARQFFDRMDKPQVDSIEGIPPAIAIEQRNSVKTTRSTVGTMTEICDYMKVLWPEIAELHCRQCGRLVRKEDPQMVWMAATSSPAGRELLVTFGLPLSDKLSLEESLGLVAKQGYQRLLLEGTVLGLDEVAARARKQRIDCLTVVQDKVRMTAANRPRFVEACEQAYHFGKGELALHEANASADQTPPAGHKFSNRLHCARCNIEYRDPSPALFSFNHPLGACPKCKGFGRIISIDYDLVIPDKTRTLAQGIVKPWLSGQSAECQGDLMRTCRRFGVPTDVRFCDLPRKWQELVVEGEPDHGKDDMHEWPHSWYGVKGYFRWLESRSYKMHVRVLLSRYRSYTRCPDCSGTRFNPDTLLYSVAPRNGNRRGDSSRVQGSLALPEFYALPVRDALRFIERLELSFQDNTAFALVLGEVVARLRYLEQVGLGYLTLDRPTRSLSGGETERVNLTTCLGTRLVNTLFVLDEPSVGLHPRDTDKLIQILIELRNAGNTVLVVEHDPAMMRAADQLVDLGPGHGATGGQLVFQGSFEEIIKCGDSLTGAYLAGRTIVGVPPRRPVARETSYARSRLPRETASTPMVLNDAPGPATRAVREPQWLRLSNVTKHNLRNFSVEIPLERLVCITGVSGSGKTTLIREALVPSLAKALPTENGERRAFESSDGDDNGDSRDSSGEERPASGTLRGVEHLDGVVLVDQSTLGKTPRSNPAVYVGAFEDIREIFAKSELATKRGLKASAFSFNSGQGQCQRCRGAGFEKIEMQFLSDVFVRCPDCDGRRYRPHILEVKIKPPSDYSGPALSIADLLEVTIEEAVAFLSGFGGPRAEAAVSSLRLLDEVGLGYLRLGQPINTLSGGESQRLKLVRHLAQVTDARASSGPREKRLLFLFDEPTTGLHFDDVRVLLQVFQRLVDAGHSGVVIEHNLDVIKSADWVIDLGPEAGDQGGRIVVEGTPEEVAGCAESHTGRALRRVLHPRRKREVVYGRA
jgi:excinuclease ABC subunit A